MYIHGIPLLLLFPSPFFHHSLRLSHFHASHAKTGTTTQEAAPHKVYISSSSHLSFILSPSSSFSFLSSTREIIAQQCILAKTTRHNNTRGCNPHSMHFLFSSSSSHLSFTLFPLFSLCEIMCSTPFPLPPLPFLL